MYQYLPDALLDGYLLVPALNPNALPMGWYNSETMSKS